MGFGEEVRDSEEGMLNESAVGVAIVLRVENGVEGREHIIGDELMSAWLCLGASVVSKAFDPYTNS
jgi:hypothetical protein